MHELDPPLIHRDVKSPNILLTSSLPDARARLADLGCTKVHRLLLRAIS
jgi:serine/threonine protein kinase